MTDKTYMLEVDGLGAFEVRESCTAVTLRTQAEANRLSEGQPVLAPWFAGIVFALALLKTRIVKAPDGWDPDALDIQDDRDWAKVEKVVLAIREKDRFFREKRLEEREAPGTPASSFD